MDTPQETDIRIDIVSDVVCPWCIVGYKQLEKAMEATGIDADIHWHPFELNPDMPAEGENLRDHVQRKYGSGAEASNKARQRLTELGQQLDFPFSFFEEMRIVNTFRAHQLLHWADTQGREHDLKLRLFSTYFSEQADVSDPAVLIQAAADVGLDSKEAAAVLEDGRYADAVRERQSTWIRNGIQGVPAMIFQGKYLLSGAQGVDNYTIVLKQLATGEAA